MSRANAHRASTTLIRWWEWFRALEVERWQEGHRVGWDAADGRNGGAERTAWETLLEVERFDYRTRAMGQGAITLVLDLAKVFERVSLTVVWAWATHFNIRQFLQVLCGYFEHQQSVLFEGCVAQPLQTELSAVAHSTTKML